MGGWLETEIFCFQESKSKKRIFFWGGGRLEEVFFYKESKSKKKIFFVGGGGGGEGRGERGGGRL